MADGRFVMAGGAVFQMRAPLEIRSQCGAICWRRDDGVVRVLLVTSRDTGRWVIPKGGQIEGLEDADSAAQEAWEEAGIRGRVMDQPVGHYTYRKVTRRNGDVDCDVAVFPLEVTELAELFPEYGQRRRVWFSPAEAAHLVAESDLAQILANFSPPGGGTADSLPLRTY